jgi:hypothetical protein
METKENTNEVEQEIVNPQDSATAIEAGNATESNTANNAEEPKEQNEVHENSEVTAPATDIETAANNDVEVETTTKEVIADETITTETESKNDESEEVSSELDVEDNENSDLEAEKVDYASMNFEELISKMIELVATDDIASIKSDIGEIKSQYIKKIKQVKQEHFDKFIANGGVEDEYETIKFDFEQQYQAAYQIYKEKKSIYTQQLEKQKEENLKLKEELLESLRQMINSNENLNKIYNEFKELQEKWREIGQIPQSQTKILWENYHFLVEKFFDKVKINKELMMMGLNKNLEEKISLCEKTEDLLLEKSINKSFNLLQEYHEKWKEIGPVPQDKNDEIWDRFKVATDKVNQRRHEYYENLHEEQKSNLLLKTALCEKAESYNENIPQKLSDWNNLTTEVNALMEEWKTLGPAPKKYNDSIWKRFKSAINEFYNSKKEFIGKIKDEQMTNYNIKLDLIAQVEALKTSNEWKKTTQEIINIQRKWKETGQVPRKYSDKIWKTFRAHCDDFFNAKDEFFKNIGKVEKDNKVLKIALIEDVKNYKFGENQEENLKAIKDFQRRWIEIGRVPIKDKSKLQQDFKSTIDKHLNALNINIFEFENAGLKSKIDGMKNKGDAERLLRKEISFYKNKVDALIKDLSLWENNISFFANSKNADLLKADFEKKIAKGNKEVDVLNAKIRQFDKMLRDVKA